MAQSPKHAKSEGALIVGRVGRAAAGVLGVLACVIVTAGCTGSGAGRSSDVQATATVSPSATASETGASDAGGASLPAENQALDAPKFEDYPGITHNTDQGAEETTRFFFDALYYGYATGDTAPLEKVSEAKECGVCSDVIAEIENWHSRGRYTTPVLLMSDELSVISSDPGNTKVFYSFKAPQINDIRNGKIQNSYSGVQYEAGISLIYKSHSWLVIDAAWQESSDGN